MANRPNRVTNFNPGPAALPLPALERAQRELLDFEGTGMSILEHSHRGKDFERVHAEALALVTELLEVPATHQVMFLQGGASQQFALIPMNLRTDTHGGDYVLTGVWAQKAFEEAKTIGKPVVAADTSLDGKGKGTGTGKFTRVPKQAELKLSADAPYVHITSNNTIYGTQYHVFPDTGTVPLVADMSSDLLWKPIDVSRFGLIYAGAQKNIGPSGVVIVIMRRDLIESGRKDIPKVFRYATHAHENSLYNTAPTFAIYMVRNVLAHLKEVGGVRAAETLNRRKADALYAALEASDGFYRSEVEKDSRSYMNVVFRLPSEQLEQRFVADATQAGMVGLKGHRLAGGIRASIYNAVSLPCVEQLVGFMAAFRKSHG